MPIPTRARSVIKKPGAGPPIPSTASDQTQVHRDCHEVLGDFEPGSEANSTTKSDDRIPLPPSRTTITANTVRVKQLATSVPRRNVTNSSLPVRPTESIPNRVPVSSATATSARSGHSRQASTSQIAPQYRHPSLRARDKLADDTHQAAPSNKPRSGLRVPSDLRAPAVSRRPQETSAGDTPARLTSQRVQGSSHDITRLRDELFQLQLVYQDSEANLDSYQRSVRTHSDQYRRRLVKDQVEILELERARHDAQSSVVLRKWLDDNTTSTDAQQVQLLSRTIQDLADFYLHHETTTLLDAFDQWLRKVVETRQRREGNVQAPNELTFIISIEDQWHQQASRAQQKLLEIVATFRHLGAVNSGTSGLAVVLGQHLLLATTLLSEIQTAIALEKSIIQSESDWMKQQLERTLQQDFTAYGRSHDSTAKVGGIWTQ